MDLQTHPTKVLMRESGQISNWLVKIVVLLAIAGVVVIEGGAVLVARGQTADAAQGATAEAAFAIKTQGIRGDPEAEARAFATSKGVEFVSISYDQAAQTVTVTVRRKAKTQFIHKIGALKKYTVATSAYTKSYA